jgi:pseudoazurin
MKMKMKQLNQILKGAALVVSLGLSSASLFAAEYTVNLQTSGENAAMMLMAPGYIKIEKGDVINFIPSDASHNAESFSIPEGGEAFNTPYGKAAKVTFNKEGVYLYKCLPHTIMGMVGVIQVGSATNLEQAKVAWETIKPTLVMNKERMDDYLKQVK